MAAYYNEFDPKAAAWLRELIRCGLIADGVVDERSILDVQPADLAGFTQCHFFAGVGGWSLALRLAGWPDSRSVWTGSPPCQPFSAAGRQLGKDDERHLAPHFASLVATGRPDTLFGEQVASAAVFGKASGRSGKSVEGQAPLEWAWLDDLFERLEAAHYACGASDIPAAGVGAAHIRQRTFFGAQRMDDPAGARHDRALGRAEGTARDEARLRVSGAGRGFGGLADSDNARLEGRREPGRECAAELAVGAGSVAGGMADAAGGRHQPCERDGGLRGANSCEGAAAEQRGAVCAFGEPSAGGPTNGLWADADWLFCRDGKWRPVEPLTFPLAHGVPARVGRLRGYGNAIVPQVAAAFINAFEVARGVM